MKLPPAVPELPVTDIRAAADAYAHQMGFTVDWTYEDHLAGISRDATRVFLRRRTPEENREGYSVLIWLNMASSAEVDQLHAEWRGRGVLIVGELHTTPYKLREFTAEDRDGNRLRVFFDLGTASRSADEEDTMKSIEDRADGDYGSQVLAAFRKNRLSTSQWNYATLLAMEKASRLEFLDLFKKHDRLASYALIELIRTGTPEELVEHLIKEQAARDQMMAMIPVMFIGIMGGS